MLFLYCKILFVTNPLCIWSTLEAEILNGYRESECDCSRHPNTDYSQLLLAYTNTFNTFSWSCYSDVLGTLYQFRWMWFYNIYIICFCRYQGLYIWMIHFMIYLWTVFLFQDQVMDGKSISDSFLICKFLDFCQCMLAKYTCISYRSHICSLIMFNLFQNILIKVIKDKLRGIHRVGCRWK